MFEPNRRVKVNLAHMTVHGVSFSENVREALGTIVRQVSVEPPIYLVELLFTFRGIKRLEVPESRIQPMQSILS